MRTILRGAKSVLLGYSRITGPRVKGTPQLHLSWVLLAVPWALGIQATPLIVGHHLHPKACLPSALKAPAVL